MERDIHELIAADSITFTKFLTAVAARTGEMLNYKNIAGDVGVSEPTIKTGFLFWKEWESSYVLMIKRPISERIYWLYLFSISSGEIITSASTALGNFLRIRNI